MRKRAIAFILCFVLLAGLLPVLTPGAEAAAIVSINDDSVFLKQAASDTCTLVATLMMFRRGALISKNTSWNTFTEADYKSKWFISGMNWNPSGLGMKGGTYTIRKSGDLSGMGDGDYKIALGNISKRRELFIELLEEHKEGIVIYFWTDKKDSSGNSITPHAVLLTDYNANTNKFYCADPAKSAGSGRIPLGDSILYTYISKTGYAQGDYSKQDYILGYINQIWMITSGIDYSASPELNCTWDHSAGGKHDGASTFKTVQKDGIYTAVCKNCGWEFALPAIDTADAGLYKVNAGGTTACSAPYADAGVASLAAGAEIGITGSLINAYGNKWYKTTNKQYVYSSYVTKTGELPLPSAPSNLTAAMGSSGSISLSWSKASGADSYQVQYNYDGGSWTSDPSYKTKTAVSYTSTGKNEFWYKFRVRSVNQYGSSAWKTVAVSRPLDPPTKLKGVWQAHSDGACTAKISWTGSTGAATYEVQYKRSGIDWTTDSSYTTDTATSYVSKGLKNYSSYQFRVRAVNPGATSSWVTLTIKKSFKVTYDANGGSVPSTTQSYTYADGKLPKVKELPTATRSGYTFDGWYTSKTGGTKISVGSELNFSKDTTLYAHWTEAMLNVDSITVDRTTAKVGETITWTVTVSGGEGAYRYSYYIDKDGITVKYVAPGASNPYSYVPTEPGTYIFTAWVEDEAGSLVDLEGGKVTVTGSPLTVTGVTASKTAVSQGQSITWTAGASGGSGSLQYCFYVFQDGQINTRGAYGTANTFSFTPAAAGTYTVRVYVKDAAGTVVTKDNTAPVTVSGAPLTVTGVTAGKTAVSLGQSITWTAGASGGSGSLQYCFYVFKDGKIDTRGTYGASNTFSFAPAAAGTYTVRVYVKDAAGTVATRDNAAPVAVSGAPLTVTGVTANKTAVAPGETVTWTAAASGGSGSLQYCFYVFKDGKIDTRGTYGASNTFSFAPAAPGTYTVRVYVKDAAGTVAAKDNAAPVTAAAPLALTGVTVSKAAVSAGTSVTWTANATGGSGSLQYCFYVFKNGKIDTRGSYGPAKTFTFTPTSAGTWTVRVYVKDAAGTVVTQDNAGTVKVS